MEKNCKYILWDLDGTLTDPMIGITTCVQYALRHLGIEVKDLQELCPFIGPPLLDSFQEFYRLSEAQAQEAILKYRERFATVGWLENEVYPGMPELLDRLCQAGKTMMVATSKPEVFARKILDHFQLAAYFSFVGGATLDGVRSTKEEVIDYVLKTKEVVSLSEVIMVGDRKFVISSGEACGSEFGWVCIWIWLPGRTGNCWGGLCGRFDRGATELTFTVNECASCRLWSLSVGITSDSNPVMLDYRISIAP